jgi:hypothetical protein
MPETHDLTGFFPHDILVLAKPQAIFDGGPRIPGMREQNLTFTDGNVRRCLYPVLTRPGIDRFEQYFMSIEHVAIRQVADPCEVS